MFHHLRPYSDAQRATAWREGIIVLDTNILLHLYRMDNRMRDALFSILEDPKITPRLWFPYQVIAEFYKNRPKVITGQLRALDALTRQVDSTLNALKEVKDTPRFHIDREAWAALLAGSAQHLSNFLGDAKKAYQAAPSHDPWLLRLETALDGRVGPLPTPEDAAKHSEEGKRRISAKLPPGYEDCDKDDNGDYIMWAQCLAHCETTRTHLLLVTDDATDDWWQRISGMTIGPRPELRK